MRAFGAGQRYGRKMRIASFQRRPIYDDMESAAAVLAADLLWAEAQGVDLALFPECFLHGHSYDRATIERRAIGEADDDLAGLLTRLSPYRPAFVLGAFERRGCDVYNSAFVIEAGKIIGRYSKAHPNEEGVAAGNAFPTFTRAGRRFGINICYDGNFPDAAARLAAGGASLICFPLNNMMSPEKAEIWRSRSVEILRARARETGCWVASADVTGEVDKRIGHGCTVIVNPTGEVVARVPEGEEGAAVWDLPTP